MQQKIVPNLWFDTQAEEAAEFYVSVFGELADHRARRTTPRPGRARPAW